MIELSAEHLAGDALSILAGGRSYACDVEPGKEGGDAG